MRQIIRACFTGNFSMRQTRAPYMGDYTREQKHFPMIVRGFLTRDKEGSSVAYSVVRKLGPSLSRAKKTAQARKMFSFAGINNQKQEDNHD
jgi:hypothetical protein